MLQSLTNSRERENSSILSSSCREGLAPGRGDGGLTRGTATPRGLSAEHLLSNLPGFFRKNPCFHTDKWNFGALLEALLTRRRILAGVSFCSLYVCGRRLAEPGWEKMPKPKVPLHSLSLGELGRCPGGEADCPQRRAGSLERCCDPVGCPQGAAV